MRFDGVSCDLAALRSYALEYDLWDMVKDLKFAARQEVSSPPVVHAQSSPCSRGVAATVSFVTLGQTSGSLCACFVRERSQQISSVSPMVWRTWELLVFMLFLRARTSLLEAKPTLASRRDVVALVAKDVGYTPWESMSRRRLFFTPAATSAKLAAAVALIGKTDVMRAQRALMEVPYSRMSRNAVLRSVVKSTWLADVERDETEVLMGLDGACVPESFPSKLRELLMASTVHEDPARSLSFHLLPRYAADFFLRSLPVEAGLGVQVVAYEKGLVVCELAALWSPREASALCDLSRAVAVLKDV